MAAEMFDTLAFSKRLQAGKVPAAQADAHASAQAELVIAYLLGQVSTKEDLKGSATKEDLKAFATRDDLKAFATKEDLKAFATREDLKRFAAREDLKAFATRDDLKRFATKEDLKAFATKEDLEKMAAAIRKELADLAERTVTEEKLMLLLDLRDKRMTIRLGGMILAAVVAVSTFMRFMQFSVGG